MNISRLTSHVSRLTLALSALFAFSAVNNSPAQLPTFASFTASGTSSATVIVPHQPRAQARLLCAISSSDLATSTLTLQSGGASYYVFAGTTNLATNSIILNTTNGWTAGAVTNTCYVTGPSTNTILVSTNMVAINITNAGVWTVAANVFFPANIGFVQAANSEVEIMGSTTTLGIGAATNVVFSSEALFVGKFGRAVTATLTGTSACAINALTAKYDMY